MSAPRCITCGNSIGHIYVPFIVERRILVGSKTNGADLSINTDCSEIFKRLNITNMCCKMHLNTMIPPYKEESNLESE